MALFSLFAVALLI